MRQQPKRFTLRRSPALLLRIVLGLTAVCGLVPPLTAQPQPVEKAQLEVVADRTAYSAGSTVHLALFLDIDEGWHVNSHWPSFDYLIPTSVEVALPTGWDTPEIEYPEAAMKSFSFADQPLSVYDGKARILVTLVVPDIATSSTVDLGIDLRYQACDDRSCLPPVTTAATVQLALGDGGAPTHEAAFQAAPTAATRPPVNLLAMLVMGILGGLILNAMPCVLPVLSLKLLGLIKSSGQGSVQVTTGSLATAAGILVSFWGLALAAVLARGAGNAVGWGVQFQNPVFVTVLAVVVILFCFNLWGIFEIQLPMAASQAIGRGPREGLSGHFSSGLFATLMATPCSAPFLGTAVGFALSQGTGTVFAIFTAVGFGMALPYLILAAFPRSARFLPKPGAWMETLKGVMGFLLAGAAIWLFYVLAAQIPAERLAFIQLAILVLALAVWLRIAGSGPTAASLSPAAATRSSHLDWLTFDRIEAERQAAAGRLVFVDVTADWCFTCKVNERLALETEATAAAFDRLEVVAMKADWTNRDDDIAEFLADHGRYGVPFYILYRPGREPHIFSELLTQDSLLQALDEAGVGQ